MPSLERFFNLTRTVELSWVEHPDEVITVRYKHLGYTPAFTDRQREEATIDGVYDDNRYLYIGLREIVVSWDLTDAKGKEIQRDDASLSKLPRGLLMQLYLAIMEDMAVNPPKRRPIGSTFAPMDAGDAIETEPGPSASPTERVLTPVS